MLTKKVQQNKNYRLEMENQMITGTNTTLYARIKMLEEENKKLRLENKIH